MNKDTALQLLGFDDSNETISELELRQHYRMYALMYHPDKNVAEDASLRFLEIKEAYDVLQKYIDENNTILREDKDKEEETTYFRILKEYLGIQIVDDKINDILDNLLSVCEKQSIHILEKIEGKKFEKMYSILKKYRHVFFLSEQFYQQMECIKEKKTEEPNEIIILYPTINDLMQHMVYKLNRNNEIYLVPLWHHELIYEDKYTDKEFIVRCIPNITKDYWIDDQNNIHCHQTYNIQYMFEKSIKKEKIEVFFGDNKSVFFNPCELKLIPNQIIRWRKEGMYIPETTKELKKADILVHISLELN
jgi:hypothetical protein